jgi:hypothetical protein
MAELPMNQTQMTLAAVSSEGSCSDVRASSPCVGVEG